MGGKAKPIIVQVWKQRTTTTTRDGEAPYRTRQKIHFPITISKSARPYSCTHTQKQSRREYCVCFV